ncbi:alginate lyase family protein [Actinoallomurus purpureus]|uniref:alginate lyase family protein n=1 Tax=Actinoallomurus purpureus TaxID=478114 RepID=UPI002092563C|nr:alginate lyase family protein [Actinoallomurus purpureus]MCO6003428.1 alginate lyase family protein [Actinoallomurus purpureus]
MRRLWTRRLVALSAIAASALAATPTVASASRSDGAVAARTGHGRAPGTVVLDGARLMRIRQRLATRPDRRLRTALGALTRAADAELRAGPWSVMDKATTVSADEHDYYSLATYWWPSEPKTPDNPYGCPFVQHDGHWAPDVATTGDLPTLHKSWTAISDLSLAWFYTRRPAYARRAALDIRTWFLDPATRMNPNMDYAQAIPCGANPQGRNYGIIESAQAITQVIDALAILDSGAPGWKARDRAGIRDWLGRFLDWMQTSPFGQAESATKNNHGTFKDLQDAAIALYIGRTDLAKQLIVGAEAKRIDPQIAADGSQPGELSRTRPWHYANFNAQAFCRLADTARRVGVDLWSYTAPNGGSIPKAIDFLIPAAEKGADAWPYPDLDVFDRSLVVDKLHAAATEANDGRARAALPHVPTPQGGDRWPVEPTCWQDLSQPPLQK